MSSSSAAIIENHSASASISVSASTVSITITTTKKTKKQADTNPDNECQVCCSTLNKSTNKPIVCPSSGCAYSACVSCIRTYLLENPLSTPHCMACKKPFNNLFLVDNLSKVWTNEKYKPYVSNVMVDIEISKLSESMEEAENIKKRRQINADIASLKAERDAQINKIVSIFIPKHELLLDELNKISNNDASKRKTFTMPCSYNNCNGMLSMQYKCGLCDKFTCKDCHEPKQEEHKCNPDNVATTLAIQKETRPCPSCNTRIYKIEGCDQMWCTSCKTPFSWITGKIVQAGQRIHNPHAIEFLKQNGINIRAPGDLVCGGIITFAQFTNIEKSIKNIIPLLESLTTPTKNINQVFIETLSPRADIILPTLIPHFTKSDCIFTVLNWNLYTVYTIVNEVSTNKLREAREVAQTHHDFNRERVQIILNEINKDVFADKIRKYNSNKNVNLELSFIWEILSTFGIEMFNTLYNARVCKDISSSVELFKIIFQKLTEFSSLIKYVNSQLAIISVAHSCSVSIIEYTFDSSKPMLVTVQPCRGRRNWLINPYNDLDNRLLFKTQKYSKVAMTREYSM